MTIARFSEDLGVYRTAHDENAPWAAMIGGTGAAFLTGILLFIGAVELGSLPDWSHTGVAGLGIFGFIITLLVEIASFSVGAIVTNWLRKVFAAPPYEYRAIRQTNRGR